MTRPLLPVQPLKTQQRVGLAVAGLMLVVVSPLLGTGPPDRDPDPTIVIEPVSDLDRVRYLRLARVWTEHHTSELDLKAGPVEGLAFDPSLEVTCDYHTPGVELGGATPKFLCRIGTELFKVKYLPSKRYGTARPDMGRLGPTAGPETGRSTQS